MCEEGLSEFLGENPFWVFVCYLSRPEGVIHFLPFERETVLCNVLRSERRRLKSSAHTCSVH